jgi:multiple sugar transport system permease protein
MADRSAWTESARPAMVGTTSRLGRVVSSTLVLAVLALGTVTTAAPFVWMVLGSIKAPDEMVTIPLRLLPSTPYWSNYSDLMNIIPFPRFYVNSVVVGACVTAGVVVTASLGAYGFARVPFYGRDLVFMVYLGTIMVPGWITLIPAFLILRDLGWINTYQGLIVPGMTSAFGTFLLRQFFLSIPQDLEDAAFIDGANRLQSFAWVVAPLARPAMMTVGLLAFMNNWNSLLWPLIISQSEDMQTLPLGLARLVSQVGWVRIDWGPLMAGAFMSVLPLLLLFVFLQSYFTRGVVLSGMK